MIIFLYVIINKVIDMVLLKIIIGIVIALFVLLLIFSIIINIFYKPIYKKIVGRAGEHWVKKRLSELPQDTYYVLNNIMISAQNTTHQIDHIVVSKYGIFVIEAKQYTGYIVGNKYDKKWTRKVGKKTYYYLNPIRQNYGHVKSICELLNIEEDKVFNIVCVPSTAKLKVENDGELTRYYNLTERILSYKTEIIDNPEYIYNFLYNANITDKEVRKEHGKYVNQIREENESKCPKCGGTLVIREGKYGEFIGCSNYPKCKFTSNIK